MTRPACTTTALWVNAGQGTGRVTKEFYRDKDFSVTTDLSSSKKKKKRLSRFGASQLGIRAKIYELPGTQCLVQASQLGVRA